ncbi:alpha/beta fold hydrolase [Rhizobium mayense]|uniref:Alpha/beta hydrolase n=1 Tax=Rhizobium mayense TaxID=1312184 RepID=A0ABT7K3B9_9HYPH|nr:alpha/beta hydrolase [Rhizobium mayense]MDL2403093.1 alpha/beta hydrolase [Rhizobium mayense]
MTGKTDLHRRALLRAMTAASGTVLASAIMAKPASAQSSTIKPVAGAFGPTDFEPIDVETKDNTIFVREYGSGSPLLLVHGFPRSSLMWRFMAPVLAKNHTVICVDLRGYGRSGVPASGDNHYAYSKRAMGDELVEVMDKLGFSKFDVVGHDRGARVAYRLTLDHPEKVLRLAAFDAIPPRVGVMPMQDLLWLTGPGRFLLRRHRFLKDTLPVIRMPSSTTHSAKARLVAM